MFRLNVKDATGAVKFSRDFDFDWQAQDYIRFVESNNGPWGVDNPTKEIIDVTAEYVAAKQRDTVRRQLLKNVSTISTLAEAKLALKAIVEHLGLDS